MKRQLFVAVAILAACASLVSTGAFVDSPEATDSIEMAPSDGPNSVYAENESGEIELDLGEANQRLAPEATGVSENTVTEVRNIFTVTYTADSSSTVDVWIETPATAPYDDIEFVRGTNQLVSIDGEASRIRLAPEETVHIGLVVDTTGDHAVEQVDEFTLVAQNEDGDSGDGGDPGGGDDPSDGGDPGGGDDPGDGGDPGGGDGPGGGADTDSDGPDDVDSGEPDSPSPTDPDLNLTGVDLPEIGGTEDGTLTEPAIPGPQQSLGGFLQRTLLLLVVFVIAGASLFSVTRHGLNRADSDSET